MSEHGDSKHHARILNPSEMSEEEREAIAQIGKDQRERDAAREAAEQRTENFGKARMFSPSEVERARQLISAREAQQQQEDQARAAEAESAAHTLAEQNERRRVAQEPTMVIRSTKPQPGGVKGFFKRLFGGK